MSMTAYDTRVFAARARARPKRRVASRPLPLRPGHPKAGRGGGVGGSSNGHTPVGRKGIRFLFRNPAAEPHTIRALVRVFVGVTQNDLETPSGDPGRVFFSV